MHHCSKVAYHRPSAAPSLSRGWKRGHGYRWCKKLYRPISNLTFMSKTVERLVYRQLERNNLLPSHQSAYRRYHSTETAMLKIVSDLAAADVRSWSSIIACFTPSVGRIRYSGPWNSAWPPIPSLRNSWKRSWLDQILCHWRRANSRLHRRQVSRVLQSAMWCAPGQCPGPDTIPTMLRWSHAYRWE